MPSWVESCGFAVQLRQPAAPLQLSRCLGEDRRKTSARPTPTGPDINQQRQIALDLIAELALLQIERRARQGFGLAASAARRLLEPVGRNAIKASVCAGNDQGLGHGEAPQRYPDNVESGRPISSTAWIPITERLYSGFIQGTRLDQTGVSGQNQGITSVATTHSRRFSGIPTFIKSVKR